MNWKELRIGIVLYFRISLGDFSRSSSHWSVCYQTIFRLLHCGTIVIPLLYVVWDQFYILNKRYVQYDSTLTLLGPYLSIFYTCSDSLCLSGSTYCYVHTANHKVFSLYWIRHSFNFNAVSVEIRKQYHIRVHQNVLNSLCSQRIVKMWLHRELPLVNCSPFSWKELVILMELVNAHGIFLDTLGLVSSWINSIDVEFVMNVSFEWCYSFPCSSRHLEGEHIMMGCDIYVIATFQ